MKQRWGDAWGALAATLVSLPAAIAFGLLVYAPLGPEWAASGALAGVVGAIALGLIAPAIGGTPRLITAPCAPAAALLSALAAQLVAPGADGTIGLSPADAATVLTLVGLMAGFLQLLIGASGGGRFIKYIPYPVVAGYLSAVGALLFLSQLPRLLGLPAAISLGDGLREPSLWRGPGIVVGTVTIAVTLVAPKLTRRVPATILGLAAGIAAYVVLGLFDPRLLVLDGNPLVVGRLPGGIEAIAGEPARRLGALMSLEREHMLRALFPAVALAVLLSIDTLKTCVVVEALTGGHGDSSRELRGQGAGNITSALVGGMPGAGTMGSTLVNLTSGGTTRWSGQLEGVFALFSFLLFSGLMAWVPIAALAAILLVIAVRMVDRETILLLRQRSTVFDFAVVAAVVVTALATDLIRAAGVGVALAVFLFLRQEVATQVVHRKSTADRVFSKKRRLPAELSALARRGQETTVCELQGILFFGTVDQLRAEIDSDLDHRRVVILDLRRVQSLDFTAAHRLQQMADRLRERDGELVLSDGEHIAPGGQSLTAYLTGLGVLSRCPNLRLFAVLSDALEWVEDRILVEEGFFRAATEAPLALDAIDLFADLDPTALDALRPSVLELRCDANQRVFHHRDIGDELFLIRKGAVRILLPLAGAAPIHIATFARADFFGEIAFLDRAPRTADAVAAVDTDLYVVSRDRFDAFAKLNPEVGREIYARLARVIALRLRTTDAEVEALRS